MRRKGNLLLKMIQWDTDTTSYDVDVFLTPAGEYTVKSVITDCDGIATYTTRHFVRYERCMEYIESLDADLIDILAL